jgi:tetratricopeptide (TPR) repeat protein
MLKGSLEKNLQQAKSLVKKQEFDAAHQIYKEILGLFPKNPRVQAAAKNLESLQGRELGAKHRLKPIDELLKSYESGDLINTKKLSLRFLEAQPENVDAWSILGAAYKGLGQHQGAVEAFERVVQLDKQNANGFNNLGVAYHGRGLFQDAIDALQLATTLKEDYAEAYFNLGNVFFDQGEWLSAITSYQTAICIKPGYVKALNNLGSAFQKYKKFDEAVDAFEKALAIIPDYAAAHNNKALALQDSGRLTAALQSCEQAVAIDTKYSDAFKNLGNILLDLNRLDEAEAAYKKALSINSNFPEATNALGLLNLRRHAFFEGFRLYESRWNTKRGNGVEPKFLKPRWSGEDKSTVFLWAEQGIGDEIMFSSFIPDAKEICSSIIVQCDGRLKPLFERSFDSSIQFVSKSDFVPESHFDFQLPFGSLGAFLRNSKSDFKKAAQGYLVHRTDQAEQLKYELSRLTQKKYFVGVSWRSASILEGAHTRSLSLKDLATCLNRPDVQLVNLQYGDVEEEVLELKHEFGIEVINLPQIDNFHDLDGLASLIAACNKVVSVDNSTVHLSGALGVKTQVLLPFNSDWRWGVNESSSYWYSNVELLRQNTPKDWSLPLSKIYR